MIPHPWQSRLDQDVLMFHRFGSSWRLLNRYRTLVRANGVLYGGLYWLEGRQPPYRYGQEVNPEAAWHAAVLWDQEER